MSLLGEVADQGKSEDPGEIQGESPDSGEGPSRVQRAWMGPSSAQGSSEDVRQG